MKPTIQDIQRWRVPGEDGGTPGNHTWGAFLVPLTPKVWAAVISSGNIDNEITEEQKQQLGEAADWEHVSVHIREQSPILGAPPMKRIPTWIEMCMIKDLFFWPNEVVVQFHPAKADHININPNVLHLWRWTKGTFPMPPKLCV